MYKSPITIIESTVDAYSKVIIEQRENAIFAKIQDSFGVDLDKHELMRALQYDRNQYEKGYADGMADAMAEFVRCKDCDFRVFDDVCKEYYCNCAYGLNGAIEDNSFCSYGERRTDDE